MPFLSIKTEKGWRFWQHIAVWHDALLGDNRYPFSVFFVSYSFPNLIACETLLFRLQIDENFVVLPRVALLNFHDFRSKYQNFTTRNEVWERVYSPPEEGCP